MGLSERLKSIETRAAIADGRCTVDQIINSLDEEDSHALKSALNSLASTRSIHAALQQEGFKITRETIANHRKGYCRCKEVA